MFMAYDIFYPIFQKDMAYIQFQQMVELDIYKLASLEIKSYINSSYEKNIKRTI